MNLTKEVKKILKKIDSIARLGKDGYFDYCIYVDSLVAEGKYGYLELALMKRYFIDITKYLAVDDMKKDTYKTILFNSNADISKKIKTLYDTNNIYAIGYDIFNLTTNSKIGQIIEIDRLDENNKPVASEAGPVLVDLEVVLGTQSSATHSIVTQGTELYDKYVIAVGLITA